MKRGGNSWKVLLTILIMAALILDSQTALRSARQALELCIQTVIPSLFPFLFLSRVITGNTGSNCGRLGKTVCRLYRIPQGAEMILVTGLLGGYPVGAKSLGIAVASGQLSEKTARRMLIFCNAAGPAFLFGITGLLFQQFRDPWLLWFIHVFSGLCVALLIPSSPGERYQASVVRANTSLPKKLRGSLLTMAEICGWIILTRVLIAILERWFLGYISLPWRIWITGMLELSNGCVSLQELSCPGLRFVLCGVFLGFGGLCVVLQTASAAGKMDTGMYLKGKLLQGGISFLLAYILQFIIYSSDNRMILSPYLLLGVGALTIILIIFLRKAEKRCGILDSVGV